MKWGALPNLFNSSVFCLFLTHTLSNIASCACTHYFICTYSCRHAHRHTKHTYTPNTHWHKQTSLCSSLECLCERLHCEIRPAMITSPLQLFSDLHTHTQAAAPLYNSSEEWHITELTFVPLSVQSHPNLISSKPWYTQQLLCVFWVCVRKRESERGKQERHLSSPNTSHQYVNSVSRPICFCIEPSSTAWESARQSVITYSKLKLHTTYRYCIWYSHHHTSSFHLSYTKNHT